MKAHLDIKHEGTLDGDSRVRMQIDSDSTAFLMSILTDLYSDPELAVIREYSTNAYDSHREAGINDPIEIELPSALRPLFVVRDHGVGMSVDDITHHFSKYGWSSKRDTDSQVGMLGLGCKSGLAYTSQFTFIAIKNGVRATVLVTRESDGAGALQVIDTVSCYERDGVEVQIPVRESSSFNAKAERFFSFWEPGSVLINGERPKHLREKDDVLVIDPDVILTHGMHGDYLVMGNVAYPVYKPLFANGWNVIAWVPIGAVDFTPSREALQMNKRTTEAVNDLHAFVLGGLHRRAQAEIDASPTHWDALRKGQEWRNVISGHRTSKSIKPWYYRGDQVPKTPLRLVKERNLVWYGGNVESASERFSSIEMRTVENSVFLVGHHARNFQKADKERLLQWFKAEGLEYRTHVIALPILPHSPWLDAKARTIHLDDLRARYKPTSEPRAVGASKDGGYRVLDPYGALATISELPEHVVWIPADLKRERQSLMSFFSRFDDVAVIPVPKAQLDRFLRENPKAITHRDFIAAMVWLFTASITPSELAHITLASEIHRARVRGLWPVRSQIHDPELAELVEMCGGDRHKTNDLWGYLRIVCELDSVQIKPPVLGADAKTLRRLKLLPQRYPLLETLNGLNESLLAREYLRYVNLVYYSET